MLLEKDSFVVELWIKGSDLERVRPSCGDEQKHTQVFSLKFQRMWAFVRNWLDFSVTNFFFSPKQSDVSLFYHASMLNNKRDEIDDKNRIPEKI